MSNVFNQSFLGKANKEIKVKSKMNEIYLINH